MDTDRDHHIKIQLHWQCGASAHNQQAHPAGDDNAPASDRVGTWVRLSTAVVGANWGSHFIPRVGQGILLTIKGQARAGSCRPLGR